MYERQMETISCNVSKGAFVVPQTSESWNEKCLCDRAQELCIRWKQAPSSEYSSAWKQSKRHSLDWFFLKDSSKELGSFTFHNFLYKTVSSFSYFRGNIKCESKDWSATAVTTYKYFYIWIWAVKKYYIIDSKWIVGWKPSWLYMLFYETNWPWKLHLVLVLKVFSVCLFYT